LRENDKNGLRDFPGLMRIACVPQRGGINLVHVPRDEFGKSCLGMECDVFAQQGIVIQFLHFTYKCRQTGKGNRFFRGEAASSHHLTIKKFNAASGKIEIKRA
jgi:hypothetical protein